MLQYSGGIRCGTPRILAPPGILDSAEDGGEGRSILQGGVHRFLGRDSGIPDIPNHFQCGGVCGSVTLGVSYG